MPYLTTTWKHEGEDFSVNTPRLNANEPTAEWAARHRTAVAAMKVEFPPDPED